MPDAMNLSQQSHDFVGGCGVQRAGRLVTEDDFWVTHQRAADSDSLELSARSLGNVAILQPGNARFFHQHSWLFRQGARHFFCHRAWMEG